MGCSWKLREGQLLAQGHPAKEWQSQNWNTGDTRGTEGGQEPSPFSLLSWGTVPPCLSPLHGPPHPPRLGREPLQLLLQTGPLGTGSKLRNASFSSVCCAHKRLSGPRLGQFPHPACPLTGPPSPLHRPHWACEEGKGGQFLAPLYSTRGNQI